MAGNSILFIPFILFILSKRITRIPTTVSVDARTADTLDSLAVADNNLVSKQFCFASQSVGETYHGC